MCEIESVDIVLPLLEEVLNSVFGYMHEGSLQESLLEVLVLSPILEAIDSTLLPSLE